MAGCDSSGFRPALRRLLTHVKRARLPVEWTVQSLLDFVVPDVCYSCGERTAPPRNTPTPSRLPIPTTYLAHGTAVSLLGLITIVNHPYCRSCLSRLTPSVRPSRIGVCGVSGGMGWVETSNGEVLIHRPHEGAGAVPGIPPAYGEPVPLDVCSPFEMNDASLEIIHLIKFRDRRSLIPPAAGAMSYALRTQVGLDRDPVLVPVPMHPSALRRRGFNQAELLAAGVARLAGIPVLRGMLRKSVRTRRQSQTARERRASNVREAFRWDGVCLTGRHVYLVDDLATTGATAASCASVLLAAGARRVTAICLAKAV
jgi:ComF family protein